MGVPYYFKYLTTNIRECVTAKIPPMPVVLYLDFNSVVYEAKATVMSGDVVYRKKSAIEYAICEEVVRCLCRILVSVGIARLRCVYIAIDGIAPMAKIAQQRQRRFKSAMEADFMNSVDTQRQDSSATDATERQYAWDSNAITPNTKFMERLSAHLDGCVEYLRHLTGGSVEFIFDSWKNTGEGEHKLFTHIREKGGTDEYSDCLKVVYGLDADLIVLSLFHSLGDAYDGKMYLYREASYFPFQKSSSNHLGNGYLYMNVRVLREGILREFQCDPSVPVINTLTDYVLLTFLMGNDFIPNLFILRIQKGGFDAIMAAYRKGYAMYRCNLVQRDGGDGGAYRIHWNFFGFILKELLKIEDRMLRELAEDFYRFRPNLRSTDALERRKEMFHYYPKMVNETDTIRIGESGWQMRFYKYWLDGMPDTAMVEEMCRQYVEGMLWILGYYATGTCDQSWNYPYTIAPCLRDLSAYYSANSVQEYISIDRKFSGEPVDGLIQLLYVLPKKSMRCIPKEWRMTTNQSIYTHLYPTTFRLKTLYKKYYHECVGV